MALKLKKIVTVLTAVTIVLRTRIARTVISIQIMMMKMMLVR